MVLRPAVSKSAPEVLDAAARIPELPDEVTSTLALQLGS